MLRVFLRFLHGVVSLVRSRTDEAHFDYYGRSRMHLSLGKDCPEHRSAEHAGLDHVIELPQVGGLRLRPERLVGRPMAFAASIGSERSATDPTPASDGLSRDHRDLLRMASGGIIQGALDSPAVRRQKRYWEGCNCLLAPDSS